MGICIPNPEYCGMLSQDILNIPPPRGLRMMEFPHQQLNPPVAVNTVEVTKPWRNTDCLTLLAIYEHCG
jgi:hypothetical protein